jgi:phosphohistidine phosphatase SixA
MARPPESASLPNVIDALLAFTAPVTQILDHMARAPQAAGVNASVDALRELLGEVLAALEDQFPRRDLETTIAVLERATDLVLGEILLVPHDPSNGDGDRCDG